MTAVSADLSAGDGAGDDDGGTPAIPQSAQTERRGQRSASAASASSPQPRGGPELLVHIDRAAELPLHEQLEQSLREQVRAGRLLAGTRLPSTRALAAELGLSRGVITEAYGQLAAEGYLAIRQGSPVRVAATVRPRTPRPQAQSLLESHTYDMRPGVPDLATFPRDRWLRCLRTALGRSPLSAAGYPDPRGVPELREAIADYLGRVRGAAAEPEHTLICTGFTQGLSLACRALASYGVESVALEDPGWHAHRLAVEQAGLTVAAVPVDGEGILVGELARTDAAAVVVTPAHQFPTGTVMSPRRRAQLIEWAQREQRLVIEDDYDAELRHDRGAVGALQGLAPERVLHIGSASKRLAPALRIGWMLTPSWMAWQMTAAKAIEDGGSEAIGQLALADFISSGELDRHLRRMRLSYARKRARLLRALRRDLPQARALGAGGGIFEPVQLPDGVREREVVDAAAARGVGVEGMQLHRFAAEGPPGLLLGYGNIAEPAIEHAVRLLAESMRQDGYPAGSRPAEGVSG